MPRGKYCGQLNNVESFCGHQVSDRLGCLFGCAPRQPRLQLQAESSAGSAGASRRCDRTICQADRCPDRWWAENGYLPAFPSHFIHTNGGLSHLQRWALHVGRVTTACLKSSKTIINHAVNRTLMVQMCQVLQFAPGCFHLPQTIKAKCILKQQSQFETCTCHAWLYMSLVIVSAEAPSILGKLPIFLANSCTMRDETLWICRTLRISPHCHMCLPRCRSSGFTFRFSSTGRILSSNRTIRRTPKLSSVGPETADLAECGVDMWPHTKNHLKNKGCRSFSHTKKWSFSNTKIRSFFKNNTSLWKVCLCNQHAALRIVVETKPSMMHSTVHIAPQEENAFKSNHGSIQCLAAVRWGEHFLAQKIVKLCARFQPASQDLWGPAATVPQLQAGVPRSSWIVMTRGSFSVLLASGSPGSVPRGADAGSGWPSRSAGWRKFSF